MTRNHPNNTCPRRCSCGLVVVYLLPDKVKLCDSLKFWKNRVEIFAIFQRAIGFSEELRRIMGSLRNFLSVNVWDFSEITIFKGTDMKKFIFVFFMIFSAVSGHELAIQIGPSMISRHDPSLGRIP